MTGEVRDAVSAYTQVLGSQAPRLLRLPEKEFPQVLVRLPPCRRLENGEAIEEPGGHPLAGPFGEACGNTLTIETQCVNKKAPTWECLDVHRQSQLFLSVCVHDIQMVGTFVEHSAQRHQSGGSNLFVESNMLWVAVEEKQKSIMKLFKKTQVHFDESPPLT